MNQSTQYWIKQLELSPHPEGGYFREIFRSSEQIPHPSLPDRYTGSRCLYTAIYFLLGSKDISAFHKLKSDEIWHFYDGSPLDIYIISPETGNLTIHRLGKHLEKNETLQLCIPKEHWFAAELVENGDYALVGCTTAPGFEYEDFELGQERLLIKQYPEYAKLIKRLTKR